jgi:hypothetical protein
MLLPQLGPRPPNLGAYRQRADAAVDNLIPPLF